MKPVVRQWVEAKREPTSRHDRLPSPPVCCENVTVGADGFVSVDGVTLGRRVTRGDGTVCLQICDKDRRRSRQRGTRLVEVPIEALADALANS